jgi:hypothetical protein
MCNKKLCLKTNKNKEICPIYPPLKGMGFSITAPTPHFMVQMGPVFYLFFIYFYYLIIYLFICFVFSGNFIYEGKILL